MKRNAVTSFGFLLVSVAVVASLTSCASSGVTSRADGQSETNGFVGERSDGGEPAIGGTLSVAMPTNITSLDPADHQDGGASGGTEMAAIYDLLMRYDTELKEYRPQLAQSLDSNADNTVWTLNLREGAEFSDGTAVDAAAVQWSINRYLEKKGTHAGVWKATVANIAISDASTIVFTLQKPWSDFPRMLTTGPGMIVAPSSMSTGAFTPVGAGAYKVEKFAPHNELVLAANPNYWGGRPFLDKLRFPVISGEQAKLDTLYSGGIQAAFLTDPQIVDKAMGSGLKGYAYTTNMGFVLLLNNRDGRPTSDERVRKAVAAAIDPRVVYQRAFNGHGLPGGDMFQDWSQWHTNSVAAGYDPNRAKMLLAEAKDDGYDGKLTFLGEDGPSYERVTLAVQTLLENVGFTVDVVNSTSNSDLARHVYVDRDYDVAFWGYNVLEGSPFVRLYSNLHSESESNLLGYKSPEMDALLEDLQTASNDNDKKSVISSIQSLVNETAPMIPLSAVKSFIAWDSNVYGVEASADGIMLFDKAWLAG
ncbi:ABC transporter substrate-binding protein [Tomitella gaofuii]|uniref:ABC transporter substrate-binding protein n=1 Tax=Tomitella gaofuii TaxID=2760083 RepID=UPI0015FB93C5|nr:ABC transporter substrate-binding protein [Tomitella gaofuii]